MVFRSDVRTHIDLFSGIGGFALAARWAGLETIAFCENDPYCKKVLRKHWPDVPIHDDITKLDGTGFRDIFLITGGFPCQDISIAGKGAGIDGERSGLWTELHRIISEVRPRFALVENVPALTFRGGTRVIGDLAEIGYDAEWQIVGADDVGAPHKRKRIWIVAYSDGSRWNTQSLSRTICTGGKNDTDIDQPSEGLRTGIVANSKENDTNSNRQRSHRTGEQQFRSSEPADREISESGQICEVLADRGRSEKRDPTDVAYSNSAGYEQDGKSMGCGKGEAGRQDVSVSPDSSFKGGEDVADSEELHGNERREHPEQGQRQVSESGECGGSEDEECRGRWLPEPNVGRVAHGIPSRVDRLRGLGNAIVPQVAYEIINALKGKENETHHCR